MPAVSLTTETHAALLKRADELKMAQAAIIKLAIMNPRGYLTLIDPESFAPKPPLASVPIPAGVQSNLNELRAERLKQQIEAAARQGDKAAEKVLRERIKTATHHVSNVILTLRAYTDWPKYHRREPHPHDNVRQKYYAARRHATQQMEYFEEGSEEWLRHRAVRDECDAAGERLHIARQRLLHEMRMAKQEKDLEALERFAEYRHREESAYVEAQDENLETLRKQAKNAHFDVS